MDEQSQAPTGFVVFPVGDQSALLAVDDITAIRPAGGSYAVAKAVVERRSSTIPVCIDEAADKAVARFKRAKVQAANNQAVADFFGNSPEERRLACKLLNAARLWATRAAVRGTNHPDLAEWRDRLERAAYAFGVEIPPKMYGDRAEDDWAGDAAERG